MVLTYEQVVELLKINQAVPHWVIKSREYSKELSALVIGENFIEELISRIEHIESVAKAKARIKYSRDIADFFERILKPLENVFSSTGGVKNYDNGEPKLTPSMQKKLISIVGNVRDGKSIEKYIQDTWATLCHTDPAGVFWMRYITDNGVVNNVYPTYQSIGSIRNYLSKGQLVEWIVYEPITDKEGKKIWTVVDDKQQWTVIQQGDIYTMEEDKMKTFVHPFGLAPVIIMSNITDKNGKRLSPINTIVPLAKEFARDQSIKTLYKIAQGFPKHWRRAMFCKSCQGTGKDGEENCKTCGGKGELGKSDVTDVAVLPIPEEGQPVLNGSDIMGFSSPDLDTWERFGKELEELEENAFETMWGCQAMTKVQKTATEIHYDLQPQINKLNKYADNAEWIEWQMTEWIANAIDPAKDKKKQVSLIVYGRRYILEGIDTIQKKYEDAKGAGENNVVLDGIFDELLTVKFKNDPEWMRQELKKARTEPYLHQSLTEINSIFGQKESARKIYFQRWWKNLSNIDLQKEIPELQNLFKTDFSAYWLEENPIAILPPII